ncbi:hypothetical protein HAX54_003320 [Datura stramonium]|uniref:Uncharacterized protein n=1 Tax=Datura stramonium TaxID=4076 RepID=A0ABS8T6M9_DATST|nr:hypothetical protein [Datura stramonium]
MAMEVVQHNWNEVVPETAEETVEEALIGRRARHTGNDDVSSSDEEEANKDKNGGFNFPQNIAISFCLSKMLILEEEDELVLYIDGTITILITSDLLKRESFYT